MPDVLLLLLACAPEPSRSAPPPLADTGVDLSDPVEITEDPPCAPGASLACPIRRCAELPPEAPSGLYALDPDGQGPFKTWCEQALAGGAWTLIARFDHGAGEAWLPRDDLSAWEGGEAFGAPEGQRDFRSPAFARLPAQDLLATDSEGGWVAWRGALDGRSLAERLRGVRACAEEGVALSAIESSAPLLESYGVLSFFGEDPIDGQCALSPTPKTRAAVIGVAHNGCGSFGFGQLDGVGGDAGSRFCLSGDLDLDSEQEDEACREWFGEATVHDLGQGCASSALWVR